MLDAFLAQFYKAVIVVLLVLLALAIAFGAWKHVALNHLTLKHETEIATAQALTEKAKADARALEHTWSEKLLKTEIQHREDIKQILIDSNSALSAIDRLSRQIDTASSRMSTATRETIIEYATTSGHVLEKCVNEYRTVAQRADEHAADAKRLSDAWPQ